MNSPNLRTDEWSQFVCALFEPTDGPDKRCGPLAKFRGDALARRDRCLLTAHGRAQSNGALLDATYTRCGSVREMVVMLTSRWNQPPIKWHSLPGRWHRRPVPEPETALPGKFVCAAAAHRTARCCQSCNDRSLRRGSHYSVAHAGRFRGPQPSRATRPSSPGRCSARQTDESAGDLLFA